MEKTDCDGWLKLIGFQAFLDLKKRKERSLMALCRDACDLQTLNAFVIRMLGFPTSNEHLLIWLRDNACQYRELERGNLEQLKELNLGFYELALVPKEIGNLKQLEKLKLGRGMLTSLPKLRK